MKGTLRLSSDAGLAATIISENQKIIKSIILKIGKQASPR
jgi:hypothetical protein